MNYIIRIIISTIIGALIITLLAWMNGNKNYYSYNKKELIDIVKIKDPNYKKKYFNEIHIVKTVVPSKIPFIFNDKFDTLSTTIESYY